MENVVPIREPDLVVLKKSGKSLREISRETGIPRSTVALRLKQVELYEKAVADLKVKKDLVEQVQPRQMLISGAASPVVQVQPHVQPGLDGNSSSEWKEYRHVQPPVNQLSSPVKGNEKKTVDFISGSYVTKTDEEISVQEFCNKLVSEYGYPKANIKAHPQWRIRSTPSGRGRWMLDIAVFSSLPCCHDHLFIIVECKQIGNLSGLEQLKIYLSLSKAEYGVLFNVTRSVFLKKVVRNNKIDFDIVDDIPKYHEIRKALEKPIKAEKPLKAKEDRVSLRSKLKKFVSTHYSAVHRLPRNTHHAPMSWMQVFWYSSAGLICLSMVTFLVITSQPFYAESVGSQPLSWLLSVSFELLLFVLASTRTEFRVGVFSPAGFMRAFPSLLKWTIVRLAILGLAFFSYQVVTVGIDVKTAELSRSSSAEVQRDALLKDLEAERALMKSFQLAGAIGSARESSRRMEGIREQISEVSNQTTPASIVEAVETRARVEKALRALALGIVILLGHMLPLNALRKNQ